MPTQNLFPTSETDVNAVLRVLLSDARTVLGEQFIGLYVHGSLAGGDFNPDRSDVDVVIVTAGVLPKAILRELAAMHARLTSSRMKWSDKLEISYIPQAALRRYDPSDLAYPALRIDGSFDIDVHGSDWIIQRWVLREFGITMAGPDPRSLIDPISPDDLRQSARGILLEWWEPQLTNTHRLHSREYQAYAALTMCRAFYTIENGAVAPKTAAARWAIDRLGERWRDLIESALAWPHGDQRDRLEETLALVGYTLQSI